MATVSTIAYTGICGNNYIAFSEKDKGSVDSFFNARIAKTFTGLSEIFLTKDINHMNAGCVHVPAPYFEIANSGTDYIKIENTDIFGETEDNRTYYAIVQSVEQVNVNSCRIHFSVDYVASFWDTITLPKCHIIRRLEKDSDAEFSNRLPEPMKTQNVLYKLEDGLEEGIAREIETPFGTYVGNLYLCLISSVDASGNYDNVSFHYQSGSSVGGYDYYFKYPENIDSASEFLQKQIAFTPSLFKFGAPILQSLTDAYVLPQKAFETTGTPTEARKKVPLLNLARLSSGSFTSYQIKTKKIMNYVSYHLVGANGTVEFTPYDLNDPLNVELFMPITGGRDGRIECKPMLKGFDDYTPNSPYSVSTPTWPQIFVTGTLTRGLVENVQDSSSTLQETEANKNAFNGKLGPQKDIFSQPVKFW